MEKIYFYQINLWLWFFLLDGPKVNLFKRNRAIININVKLFFNRIIVQSLQQVNFDIKIPFFLFPLFLFFEWEKKLLGKTSRGHLFTCEHRKKNAAAAFLWHFFTIFCLKCLMYNLAQRWMIKLPHGLVLRIEFSIF
jgi:hypothetical protein